MNNFWFLIFWFCEMRKMAQKDIRLIQPVPSFSFDLKFVIRFRNRSMYMCLYLYMAKFTNSQFSIRNNCIEWEFLSIHAYVSFIIIAHIISHSNIKKNLNEDFIIPVTKKVNKTDFWLKIWYFFHSSHDLNRILSAKIFKFQIWFQFVNVYPVLSAMHTACIQ